MATDEARVLTARQPWAWAIVYGGKDVENRIWPTKHRGPLLIHAGSAFEPDGYETVKQFATQQPPPADEFTHGAIFGVVDLVDCRQDSPSAGDQWPMALVLAQPTTSESCGSLPREAWPLAAASGIAR
jgi:ASCH domain